ncbi:MAG: ABC transporter ATP-binding protein [Planctomycetia bacterium]
MGALPAIEIEGLWKTYWLHAPAQPPRSPWRRKTEFHALSDVSLTVPEGAVLGIVGANGAGKSTLLKVLSRVTDPSRGRVVLRGRTASILEIGTGFHPELTGIENVYLNGAVHGLSRRDIHARLARILEFAEIGDFAYEPARLYSSGMYLRLAFAVAAHLDPDILVVDELLAVGDPPFRERCLGKMRSAVSSGQTVLLVSHDTPSVAAFCTLAAWLDKGRLVMMGPPERVIEAYHAHGQLRGGITQVDRHAVAIERVTGTYERAGPGMARLDVALAVRARHALTGLLVDATVTHPAGHSPVGIMSSLRGGPSLDMQEGELAWWRMTCRVPELRPGAYTVSFSIVQRGGPLLLEVSGLPLCVVHPGPGTPELACPGFHGVQVPPHDIAWSREPAAPRP